MDQFISQKFVCTVLSNVLRFMSSRVTLDEMGGACSTHERLNLYILVGRPEGKRPGGRPRRSWNFENTVMNLRVLLKVVNFLTS